MIINDIPFQHHYYTEDYANHPEHNYQSKIDHYAKTGANKTLDQLIEDNMVGILGEYAVCQWLQEHMNYPKITPDLSVRRIASHNDDLFRFSVKTCKTNLKTEWSEKSWIFAENDIKQMDNKKTIILAAVDMNLMKYGVVGWTKKSLIDKHHCWKRAFTQDRPAIYESDLQMKNILFY